MLEFILIVVLLGIDQASKYLIQIYLSPIGSSIPVIPGLFRLTNVHNIGAAWGMLEGFRWLFIPLTILVAAALVYLLIRFRKRVTVFSRITLVLLFSGAVGNLIDRILLVYVRDFLDFSALYNFPVFNVADSCLTIGCILLIIDALFLKEKSLFERVSFKNGATEAAKTTSGDGKDA
ncbi:MAG: signal peptidase II [Eubacteriales bacterium]|nr:signal peptidase II [Eubacteriales bacterium]